MGQADYTPLDPWSSTHAVRSLVLVATSGGIDLSRFDVEDWRPAYRAEYPHAQPFATHPQQVDLSDQLATIQARTLLVWSYADPISPPEVGQYLASKLPHARLIILNHAGHTFARAHADEVAPLIQDQLEQGLAPRPADLARRVKAPGCCRRR